MRYILLLYGCDRPEPGDPRFESVLLRLNTFAAECRKRGSFVAADALKAVSSATTVRIRDERTMITDGPFAETYEQLGGYCVVDCRGLDEALELAALCPIANEGSVEVRPIDDIPGWLTAVDTGPAAVAEG